MAIATEIVESLRAKFEALLPDLDERSQRLTLVAEARSLGHGGIVAVARASAYEGDFESGTVRRYPTRLQR